MKPMHFLAMTVLLGACASAPRPLQGQFSAIQPDEAASRSATGEMVRWGGRIVAVEPLSQRSCFEVVARPLSASGRPLQGDRSEGRFIACRAGFYDPQVFLAGRELTISGRVEGFDVRKVGGYDYRYPMVAADVIYLWPERRERDPYEAIGFYGPYGPWW